MLITITYKDGIAFFLENDNCEVAFYSNITDRISYNHYNGYKGWSSIGCVDIPYEDNEFIANTVKEYRTKVKRKVWVKVPYALTPGGDTLWECPVCKNGRHVYGIETEYNYTHKCEDCGAELVYPWENKNEEVFT